MMKNTLIFSAAISAAMALSGCNGGAQSQDGMIIVDVENPVLKDAPPLSQLVESAYLIPLENDTALIKQIIKYQVTDNRIMVADFPYLSNEPIKIYDNKGKFINCLHKGNGPEEVDYYQNFTYNEQKQTLIVANGQYLIFYDNNGKFKDKIELPYKFTHIINTGNQYAFFVGDFQQNDSIESKIIISDGDFKLKDKFFPFKVQRSFSLSPGTPIIAYNDNISILRDTIYQYKDSKLTPRFYFKYGNRFSDSNLPEGESIILDQIPGYLPGAFYESENTIMYRITEMSLKIAKNVVYNKKSGNYYVYTFNGDENGNIEMPFGHTIGDCYNNYFSTIINDSNYDSYKPELLPLLSDTDKEILNSYNPDDNPIIVMFKFKDF